MRAQNRVVLAVVVAVASVGLYLGLRPVEAPTTAGGPEPVEVPSEPVAKAVVPLSHKPGRDAAVVAAAEEPAAAEVAVPDLFSGQMDDVLAEAHTRVLDGEALGLPMMRKLVEYRKAHEGDPRANMLLAFDAMTHERHGEGVRLYRMAFRDDPEIAKQPRVLRDIVWVIGRYSRQEFREASELLQNMYGDAAVPEIDRAIQKAQREREAGAEKRLREVRERLITGQ